MNWRDLLAQNKQQNNDKSGWRFFFAVRSDYGEEKARACDRVTVCVCVCVCAICKYHYFSCNDERVHSQRLKNKRERGREQREEKQKQKISRPVLRELKCEHEESAQAQ